ncbi:hypothetical protein ACJX0J_032599, partial [Zea mays]
IFFGMQKFLKIIDKQIRRYIIDKKLVDTIIASLVEDNLFSIFWTRGRKPSRGPRQTAFKKKICFWHASKTIMENLAHILRAQKGWHWRGRICLLRFLGLRIKVTNDLKTIARKLIFHLSIFILKNQFTRKSWAEKRILISFSISIDPSDIVREDFPISVTSNNINSIKHLYSNQKLLGPMRDVIFTDIFLDRYNGTHHTVSFKPNKTLHETHALDLSKPQIQTVLFRKIQET